LNGDSRTTSNETAARAVIPQYVINLCNARIQMSSSDALRSILFVPGIRPEFMPKAAGSGADALVLDLAGSVSFAVKDEARSLAASELQRPVERLTFIRINHPSYEFFVFAPPLIISGGSGSPINPQAIK
jgi:HpcH/HpaI aldolase/citrate lyase family